jgi:ABC-2 type transport system ATP-binding protein
VAGPNGSGKSSLLKAAVGALALDGGRVRVLGRDPFHDVDVRRHIGVAPQEIALWGHMSARENLWVFAALAGVPRTLRAQRVARALERAGCAGRADRRVDTFSGGWRRRVNLAAAVVHAPALVVLDEPGEGLDADMKTLLRELVAALKAEGAAVLLVSHDAEDLLASADRLLLLDGGRPAATGAPSLLFAAAFGAALEVIVRPRPDADHAILEGLGFERLADGAFARLSDDPWALARRAQEALAAEDAALPEVAVRRPGLERLAAWAAGRPA